MQQGRETAEYAEYAKKGIQGSRIQCPQIPHGWIETDVSGFEILTQDEEKAGLYT